MNCPNCGTQLASGARFCTNCGTAISAATPPPSPSVGPTIAFGGGSSDDMGDVYDNRPGERIDLPDPTIVGSGAGQGGLQYQIIGTTMQAVILQVPPGQTVFSERGGMSWMSGNVNMQTNMEGGLGGAFKRMFSGESIFMVTFTPQGGTGLIGFSAEFPGKIVPLNLGPGQQMICQKDAFMVAERSVTLDLHFRRKLGAGFFGGEGFIMQRLTGPGLAFVELDGEIVEYTLAADQMLKVDTGHVAMYEPTVQFDIEMVRGFKNILFGGEGLFLTTLRGPGRVWLQTMPAMNLAKKIAQYLPSPASSSGGGVNLGNLFSE
jgi:uncharacterized protein (TIGR00266 family)